MSSLCLAQLWKGCGALLSLGFMSSFTTLIWKSFSSSSSSISSKETSGIHHLSLCSTSSSPVHRGWYLCREVMHVFGMLLTALRGRACLIRLRALSITLCLSCVPHAEWAHLTFKIPNFKMSLVLSELVFTVGKSRV